MFLILLSILAYNLANPPIPMSFPALENVSAPVKGLEIATNSAVLGLEKSVTYRPSNTPTPTLVRYDQTNTVTVPHSSAPVQVKAVNTQTGEIIEKVAQKAVENSPVLEECSVQNCSGNTSDESSPSPTATPTPTALPTPIKLPTLPKDPCPDLPVEGKNGEVPNRLIIPCPHTLQ